MSQVDRFIRWLTGETGDDVSEESVPTAPVSPAEGGVWGDSTQPARRGIIEGTVQNGGGLTLRLVLDGESVAEGTLGQSGTFRLRNLGPGQYFLQVLRRGEADPVAFAGPLAMDGDSRRQVDLTVPSGAERPAPDGLDRYVLLGPAENPKTQVLLTLLSHYLVTHRLTFGFQLAEARQAREVILVGGEDFLPAATESELAQRGVKVHRVLGAPAEILAALER